MSYGISFSTHTRQCEGRCHDNAVAEFSEQGLGAHARSTVG